MQKINDKILIKTVYTHRHTGTQMEQTQIPHTHIERQTPLEITIARYFANYFFPLHISEKIKTQDVLRFFPYMLGKK